MILSMEVPLVEVFLLNKIRAYEKKGVREDIFSSQNWIASVRLVIVLSSCYTFFLHTKTSFKLQKYCIAIASYATIAANRLKSSIKKFENCSIGTTQPERYKFLLLFRFFISPKTSFSMCIRRMHAFNIVAQF